MKIPHILMASVLFVPMVSLAQITSDTEIMNIGGKSITKGEFEYTYRKNIQQQSEKTPLDEYVTLFGNYKLKVTEAEALGIDTTRQFITEFEGYRNQLVKPYMVDQNAEEQLAREAYDRLLEEVEASHILFRVDPSATLEEKRSAYEKALKVREEAIKGTDFSELARRYSEDPSVQNNNGYLGYFGAFYMVYPFEKAAYETAVGEISMPVETQFGYHLIKVTDRRPTRALELSHIMLKVPQNAPDKVQKEREKEIWEIYDKIQKGADFSELARRYSEDQSSSEKGGLLPLLTTGQIIPSFEKAAFALNEIGEVSKPVRTEFGWHIIKLLGERTPGSYEQMHDVIVHRMARDERADAGRKMFVEKLKEDKYFAWDESVRAMLEKEISDTSFMTCLANMDQTLFTFDGKSYPVSGLVSYLSSDKSRAVSLSELRELSDKYVYDVLVDYKTSELCRTNADFRYLLQEYRDGMLLFEISNREVWNKAMEDEKGLKKYFRKNKKKYTWDAPRYKGYVICGDDAQLVNAVKEQLLGMSQPSDSVIPSIYRQYNDSIRHIAIEKGLYQPGMNAIVDYLIFNKENTDTTDTQLPVKDVCGKILESPQSYEDVKGPVISDYQTYLDQKWIKKLRKKYPVTIRKEVLATVEEIE
ncbi:MAG TPA: peptidylprolyl isomerase [Candidatus Caccoplasma intestinavium]|uniref:Peptidylprolyl isomerase n=1 Tax=Candidatus Caccoplasma intestinavium TaxID=2840716 RepID=A0A9D1KE36_9BACT|nr:peptidylprolyl isomerase [Candidatus Caccoplasma intestinavium]